MGKNCSGVAKSGLSDFKILPIVLSSGARMSVLFALAPGQTRDTYSTRICAITLWNFLPWTRPTTGRSMSYESTLQQLKHYSKGAAQIYLRSISAAEGTRCSDSPLLGNGTWYLKRYQIIVYTDQLSILGAVVQWPFAIFAYQMTSTKQTQ